MGTVGKNLWVPFTSGLLHMVTLLLPYKQKLTSISSAQMLSTDWRTRAIAGRDKWGDRVKRNNTTWWSWRLYIYIYMCVCVCVCVCLCVWECESLLLLLLLSYSWRVFHIGVSWWSFWSLSDSKSPQLSRTLLSILAHLNSVVIWMVSIRPFISKSSSPFNNSPSSKSTNYNWYKRHFHVPTVFFSIPKQCRDTYLSHIVSILLCGQLGQQSPKFCKFFFYYY